MGVDEPVHLVDYDALWPTLFREEAKRLAEALPDAAIEHIGSTAVPGMVAKPIVDIMVGAPEAAREVIAGLGYEDLGEAGVVGRIYHRRRGSGQAYNIALVEREGSLWKANRAFRDYLRSDDAAAQEYAGVKREAIARGARTLLAYSAFKSELVSRLVRSTEGRTQ